MRIASIVFCLWLLLAGVPASAGETIILAADDWCPYTCSAESGHEGFLVDIIRAIFEPKGYTVDYRVIPWSRVLDGSRSGEFDVALGTSPYELPSGIFPQEEVGVYFNYFFVRNTMKWEYQGVDSFRGHILGGVQDYDYGSLMPYIKAQKGTPGLQLLTGGDTANRNMQKLLQRRIDIYVDDINVGLYAARMNGAEDQVRVAGREGDGVTIYTAFTSKNPFSRYYADLFDQGIRKMREDGSLAKALERYGLKDWK